MVDSTKLLAASNAYKMAQAQKTMQQASAAMMPVQGPQESAFSSMVGASLDRATTTLKSGETAAVKGLIDEGSLADLATAVTDAELTLKTVVSVRDRIISAYQDIIKMPI